VRHTAHIAAGLAQGGSAVIALTLALGCSGAATPVDTTLPDAGGLTLGVDAFSAPPEDESDAGDAGASRLLDGSASADGSVLGEGANRDGSGNARSCFDGVDDDGNMATDCEDTGCETTRVCCIGSAADACCAPMATVTTFDLTTCTGEPTGCAALVDAGLAPNVVSGSPRFSMDRALVPVSTDRVDAIVDFPSLALSPRAERILVRATISAPATSAQLDATAVGLWTPQTRAASVSPLAAVVVSATRGDVSLVVGDRVVDSTPLTMGVRDYALEITPTGEVSLQLGAETLHAVVALPAGRVVPVVFGRVTNDAPESGTTRLIALSVERRACDLPAALVRSGTLTAAGESSFEVLHATDPSVLVRAGQPDLVAFAAPSAMSAARAIYLATRDADGLLEAPERLVDIESVSDATDLGGPHLFADAMGVVSMYFAFRIASGDWRLARLANIEDVSAVNVLTTPAGSFDDPAPLGSDRLLAREHVAERGSRLVILSLSGTAATPASSLCASESDCDDRERFDDYVHTTSADPLAFDHDEVRAPVALEHGGVRRIYFAGRRGTRWSIGMLLEGDDGSFFRIANDGAAVLGPSGSGDDALGVAGPSPIVRDGELELLYAGTDGARWQLFSARMPVR